MYFERIPSVKELKQLEDGEFTIKLNYIPNESEYKRLEGVFNAHLFFDLAFVPVGEEFVNFENIPPTVDGMEVFLDHPLTDAELYTLKTIERLVTDSNLHIHILMTYVPDYEERKRYRRYSFVHSPYFIFLLSSVPDFETRGNLAKVMPPPNVLLLLDYVPTEKEVAECERIRPKPRIGILFDHLPSKDDYKRIQDMISSISTIVYLDLGRDTSEEEVEDMKELGIPFEVVLNRSEAELSLLSILTAD